MESRFRMGTDGRVQRGHRDSHGYFAGKSVTACRSGCTTKFFIFLPAEFDKCASTGGRAHACGFVRFTSGKELTQEVGDIC